MKKLLLAAVLALTTISVQAAGELYLDLGVTYVPEVGIEQRGKITVGDYTVSAEASATLEVEAWAPMVRVGYIYNGFGVEFDEIFTGVTSIRRYNAYYRFSFQ